MNERRERTGAAADLLGLVLFGAGAFVLVLVLLSIQKPFPASGASGSTALAKAVVDWLGRVPAGFLALIVAFLGARRFMGYGAERLALNLLGSLGVTAGLAILCGALWSGAGGAIGAATGGGLARISPVLGAVAGLLLMAGSAWLIWLRELVPFPGGDDLRRAISGAARGRGADGVSAAEAEALVVPNRPAAAATRGVERPAPAGAARPLPKPARDAAAVPAARAADETDETDDDAPDATPRTDRAHAAPARGPARPSAHAAPQPLVRDLAAEPRPAGPFASERVATAPTPAAPTGEPLAPAAAVNPGAAPLKGAPPLGLVGGAQALTRSTSSRPRPSWEQGEEPEATESSAAQAELAAPPNTWRPTRLKGTRTVEEVEADELEEDEELVAEYEEELEEELEDGEESDEEADEDELVAEDAEDEDEDEDEDEEDEEDEEELAAEYDEDVDEEEDTEDEEESDEEDEEEEDEAAELEEWEEEDEESDEDEGEEEVEELAAELEEEIEPEPRPAAPLPAAARAGLLPAPSPEGDEVEAELRRLLAEEDARARGETLPTGVAHHTVPASKASDAADVLQMDLFEAPPAATAEGEGLVLEPVAPPKASRRKPAKTPTPQAASPKPVAPASGSAPAAGAASLPGEGPSQLVIDAGCLFLDRGRVAVSMLQKTFDLDFDTSCEVLDTLQNLGLVGPYMGGQRRDILLTREQWLERVGQPSQAVQD